MPRAKLLRLPQNLALLLSLVVMDDGLLSTAILILFFDDRDSVGLVRLSFLDDGGAVAVSMFAGLSYSHAGAIWSGLNANADLISKGGVAMVPTGAAAIALLSIAQKRNVRVRQKFVPRETARFARSNR